MSPETETQTVDTPDVVAPAGEGPSVDDLVAEFDRANGTASPPPGGPDNGRRGTPPAASADSDDATPATSGNDVVDLLQKRFDGLNDTFTKFREQVVLADLQDQEDADVAAVIERAEEALGDALVPEGFASMWLRNQYGLDRELAESWDRRHDSDEAMKRSNRAVQSAINKLVQAAKNVPDPGATADREAVAAAVRGSSQQQPEGPPKNYGRMSDQEFSKAVEKEFGFSPGVS